MERNQHKINNEVLRTLWNDKDVRMLNRSMNEIMPGHIGENEVVVDQGHLIEAGYVGEPPKFHLRIGNLLIYARPAIYRDYWLRLKLPRKGSPNLYSIFKER